jgi:hypothetical protein
MSRYPAQIVPATLQNTKAIAWDYMSRSLQSQRPHNALTTMVVVVAQFG